MTKLVVEIKNDRQIAVVKAILRFLNISVLKVETIVEPVPTDPESFYNQFQIDLSNFKFDRQEANER
ncbi:MAG: hypothetical protein R2828_33500 [Saprospiraceae bacterium]